MVDLVRDKLPEVEELCRRFGVRQLQLFGSAYEGTFNPETSDIDLLVVMGSDSLRDYFGLLDELEKAFGRKVDLIEKQAVKNPYFIRAIREHRVTIYEDASL